jgi:hypothetical protein
MTANYVSVEPNKVIVQLHSPYGARGRGWFSGNGEPDEDIGRVGDFYIDLNTQRYFGPKSEEGWPAPFYTAGAIVTRYEHIQSSPSAEWIIEHGLGGKPSIVVVDSAGTMVIGEVTYVSDLQIRVNFTSAFAGYAYLT